MIPYYSEAGIMIYHGDCREILPSLDGVDVVVTDPPYSEHTHKKFWVSAELTQLGKKRVASNHSSLGFDAITADLARFVSSELARLVARWSVVFTDLEGIGGWRESVENAGLEYVRTCIWDKVDGAPQFTGDRPASGAEAIVCAHPPGKKQWNGGGRRNVFQHPVNGQRGNKPHPSTKPLPLMRELVGLFSESNELILDPFMGSGTTLRAAKDLGRRAIGIEIEERYCEIAAKRLQQSVMVLA